MLLFFCHFILAPFFGTGVACFGVIIPKGVFMKKSVLILAVVLSVFVPTAKTWAAAGDLDTSFDGDGIVLTDLNGAGYAMDIALDKNGKIVVVGTSATSTTASASLSIVRYNNTDGSLDTSFDGDGVVTLSTGSALWDVNHSVLIDQSGNIVVAGYNTIYRFLDDGSLDTTFGTVGSVTTTIDPTSMMIDTSTGNIVIASANGAEIARYDTNGTLDTTFGTAGGMITTGFASESADNKYGALLAVSPKGKVYVASVEDGMDGIAEFYIKGYRKDGKPDNTFGTAGTVTTDMSAFYGAGTEPYTATIALTRSGKIVVAGSVHKSGGTTGSYFVAQYLATGALDTSFDGDGIATTDFNLTDGAYLYSLSVSLYGKILLGGPCSKSGNDDYICMARFDSTGVLDTSFASSGQFFDAYFGGSGGLQLIHDKKGSILVTTFPPGGSNEFEVLKFKGK